jgi:hypothetical protein
MARTPEFENEEEVEFFADYYEEEEEVEFLAGYSSDKERQDSEPRRSENLDALRTLMTDVPSGPIPNDMIKELERRIIEAWDDISLAGTSLDMHSWKLATRMESIVWDPPHLRFRVEKHRAIAMGSTRAEIWAVNLLLEEGFAYCHKVGYRQLYARDGSLNFAKIAEGILELINNGEESHPGLKWLERGTKIRIILVRFLPKSRFKETAQSRSRKLRKKLGEILGKAGWIETGGPSCVVFERSPK